MKIIKPTLLIALLVFVAAAQNPQQSISTLSSVSPTGKAIATDTVKILAVMAEFQKDNDNTTIGDGSFPSIYTTDYGKNITDPLPHNRDYFRAHLEFAKNYYQKVSGGKLVVKFEVLPNGVTLSNTMKNYSPQINSTDFKVMGDFVQETWTLADQANPGFNFSEYDLFIIFHAGVGRDLSLPGSLGNERDLPSIYFNLEALQKFYGSAYDGVPVSGGSFKIRNTGILPQTQNREVSSFNTKYLIRVTINGLLVSTVGSYLGLPDLFDTKTGMSAIGRFGLMDGQSIFAYNGAFPPAPSPWERMRLGWETPIEVGNSSFFPSVATRLTANMTDTTLVKININNSEYFLVENRQRDALKNGAAVTMWDGASYVTKHFSKDTTGFSGISIDSLFGVIVDVDEFDWALPGSGILVWHIDDKVINEKIADNTINNDKKRRGVAVVEADGINDIGEKFYTIFGDEIIGEGTEYDFWFAENKADLYKNIFSATSRPSSRSNEGANSLITMKDFPNNGNNMQFAVVVGDSLIKPFFSGKPFPGSVPEKIYISDGYKFGNNNGGLFRFDDNFNPTGIKAKFDGGGAAFYEKGGKLYIVGSVGNTLYRTVASGGAVTIDSVVVSSEIVPQKMIVIPPTENEQIVIGTVAGKMFRYALSNFALLDSAEGIAGVPITSLHYSGSGIAFTQQDGNFFYAGVYGFTGSVKKYIGIIQSAVFGNFNNNEILFVLTDGNTIYKILTNEVLTVHRSDPTPPPAENRIFLKGSGPVKSFSLADNRLDGNLYINYTSGHELYAVNLDGAPADNFPVQIIPEESFNPSTLVADFTGTKHPEIVAFSNSGLVYAFDGLTGKPVDGFPLSTGEGFGYNSVMGPEYFDNSGKPGVATVSSSGVLNAWTLNLASGTPFYFGKFGSNANNSFASLTNNSVVNQSYMSGDKVYNYPNPVTGNETFIRYYVSEPSVITVKIFDLAGDFVAELSSTSSGGTDGEIRWDVKNIQSGVYLANVEAKSSSSGKSGHKIIKIAIIK